MPRILIVDTVYPDFLKSLPFNPACTYESELQAVLDQSFGTADFYSRGLRHLGHECVDIVANHAQLQAQWQREHTRFMDGALSLKDIAIQQIEAFGPDVVFLQDLSFFDPATLSMLSGKYFLAGQCSCPWPGDASLAKLRCAFTSFPHYVERFEALGVRAVYNPLAFDPIVIDRCGKNLTQRLGEPGTPGAYSPDRIHDCVFIGGVGLPSHWRAGMEALIAVAEAIPTFKWWGYGADLLPTSSALWKAYQGEAWGLAMYEILLQSKIALNRHGEVAQGYANNMKLFESTGMGTLLLTERAPNLNDVFAWDEISTYGSPEEAVRKIRWALDFPREQAAIAAKGQARTLKDHTYAQRMKTVSDTLTGMLCPA